MKASEASKIIDEASASLSNVLDDVLCEALGHAKDALREKAEREEQERPKVTLEEQADSVDELADAISSTGNSNAREDVPALRAAAATLRKLDEEGGRLLAKIADSGRRHGNTEFDRNTIDLLRSLGVEPKP